MNEPHFTLTFNKTTIFDKDPPVISHSRNAIQELVLGKHFRNVILHFTVVCLVVKPLNRREPKVESVVIQTLLLFVFKSVFYHAN